MNPNVKVVGHFPDWIEWYFDSVNKPITKSMEAAMQRIKECGGIVHIPCKNFLSEPNGENWKTLTLDALVRRGLLSVELHINRRSYRLK